MTTHTPLTTQTPQPSTPHNHPHPSTTHIPPTTHHPKHTHSKTTPIQPNCPCPSTTHLNHTYPLQPHTYPPTTHISQPPTPDASPSCTNEYIGTRWPRYMKSINVNKICCGQIKCSVHLPVLGPVLWPHSWAGGQNVEAAQLDDGWSNDGAALITTTSHIACIHVVQQYLNIFPQASKSSERCEYYLLYKICVARSRANVLKLRHFIELHYVIRHFIELQMTGEGQRLFLKLIHNIMLPIPTLSVWDKIMKLKLNVFPSSIWLGDKVVKLRTRTWTCLWCHALHLCCWRLALHLDKQMMHVVEEAKSSTASVCPSSWYIKDILSSHRWCHGCAENAKAPWPFIKHIEWMMVGYNEGRMVFDCYLEQ